MLFIYIKEKKKNFTKDFRGEEHYNESIDEFLSALFHYGVTKKHRKQRRVY
jgi:hypothetical protein